MLLPEEQVFVATATEQRRREFAAGRILARDLLQSLGFAGPLQRKHDGPPDWPPGVLGSITHCGTLAAVAVGRGSDCTGIGIDVEAGERLPEGVADLVLVEEERRWSHARPEESGEAGLRIFSAKEALYKAIYPISRKFLEFNAVIVEPSDDEGGFIARFQEEVAPFAKGAVVEGRWRSCRGYSAAGVVLPR